jgi:hypothetical protein
MEEILPGIFHWITFHEGIGEDVHSYYVSTTDPAVVIDPRVPDQGLAWFEGRPLPRHAYLTNRHHYRHSDRFAEAFGTEVWCQHEGLHQFTPEQAVRPFAHGSELPGGVMALEVGVLCAEETAFHLSLHGGVLSVGDAIIRPDDELGFVPDALMGDDPEGVKRGLRAVFTRHLGREFDTLLLAHGKPWVGGAKAGLRQFLESL